MILLILGYLFSLDFSSVPKGNDLSVKPRKYKFGSTTREIRRGEYGEVQVGTLSFNGDGVFVDDWFEGFKGSIGGPVDGFSDKAANGGNPAMSFGVYPMDGRGEYTVNIQLADGAEAEIHTANGVAAILPNEDWFSREEQAYLEKLAVKIAGLQG
jgi:hypothetical protein